MREEEKMKVVGLEDTKHDFRNILKDRQPAGVLLSHVLECFIAFIVCWGVWMMPYIDAVKEIYRNPYYGYVLIFTIILSVVPSVVVTATYYRWRHKSLKKQVSAQIEHDLKDNTQVVIDRMSTFLLAYEEPHLKIPILSVPRYHEKLRFILCLRENADELSYDDLFAKDGDDGQYVLIRWPTELMKLRELYLSDNWKIIQRTRELIGTTGDQGDVYVLGYPDEIKHTLAPDQVFQQKVRIINGKVNVIGTTRTSKLKDFNGATVAKKLTIHSDTHAEETASGVVYTPYTHSEEEPIFEEKKKEEAEPARNGANGKDPNTSSAPTE